MVFIVTGACTVCLQQNTNCSVYLETHSSISPNNIYFPSRFIVVFDELTYLTYLTCLICLTWLLTGISDVVSCCHSLRVPCHMFQVLPWRVWPRLQGHNRRWLWSGEVQYFVHALHLTDVSCSGHSIPHSVGKGQQLLWRCFSGYLVQVSPVFFKNFTAKVRCCFLYQWLGAGVPVSSNCCAELPPFHMPATYDHGFESLICPVYDSWFVSTV